MDISLAPLRPEDAAAIVAAEDALTVRWLSGGESTLEGTEEYIRGLDEAAGNGAGKRAFGIWADGRCVGTVDYDPAALDGLEPGDVNLAFGVAPEVRGRGVAGRAVELACALIAERGVGSRAVIRADARNPASARVAQKAGFTWLRDVPSSTETGEDGSPVILRVFGRALDATAGSTADAQVVIAAEVPSREEATALYDAVGWSAYTDDPATLERSLAGSAHVVTARRGGELLGIARVIGDGATITYLQDVLVRPEEHRTGLGRRLVGAVFAPFAHVRQQVLLTDAEPGQRAFYEALGFTEVHDHDPALRSFVRLR